MLYLIFFVGFIGILLSVWGTQTRGTWSRNIGIFGGIIWLSGVILAFLDIGLLHGVYFLIGTFALGAILSRFLPKK